MAEDPVGHVAAVAGAEGTLAGFVDEGVVDFGVVEPAHEVDEGAAAPVAVDAIDEGLAVAGGTTGIDHQHDVAVGGEQLRVPAVGPGVAPGALGSAVDEELHGVLFVLVEVGRADEEALDVSLRCAHKPKIVHLGEIELLEQVRI